MANRRPLVVILGSMQEIPSGDTVPADTYPHNHDAAYQSLDSDLTTIAALAPADDSVIQRKSGLWVARSMTQIKTDLVLVKGDVGLGSVDNTSDAAKPVSTATQTALDLKQSLSAKDASNGYCGLDSSALVPRARYYLATSTLDGTIRLTGDLGGTGTSPTVPGLTSKDLKLTPTATKTTTYTAVSGDHVLADATAGGFTVTLPAVAAGSVVAVKKTDSGANTVIVAPGGSDTIIGGASGSVTLRLQDESRTFRGTATGWVQVNGLLTTPAADGRYTLTTDSRLSDSRAPNGSAGGSLSGTYPNPTIAAGAVGGTEVAAGIKDPAAGTAGLRTLGSSSTQAAAGNHTHTASIVPFPPVTLTDAATIATDASLGRIFRVTIAADRTLGAPTNPTDGQTAIWEVTASGANRTLTLTTGSSGAFAFGTDITGLTVITSGKIDKIGCMYNSSAARWHVMAYQKGF